MYTIFFSKLWNYNSSWHYGTAYYSVWHEEVFNLIGDSIKSKHLKDIKIMVAWVLFLLLCPLSCFLFSPFVLKQTAAAAKSLQSCLTLCDPIDGSPPGSTIPGILQARTLEWVAISFSSVWKWKVKAKWLSRVRLLATPWTAAHQGPPSMGFSRQKYWSGLPLPSP